MQPQRRRFFLLALGGIAAMTHAAGQLGEPKNLTFKAKLDKSEQQYVLMLPEPFDAKAEHHVLIALHGHGSNRWQYVRESRGECKAPRDLAARYGMLYVSPDYRAATSWMGPAAEADLVQLIALIRKEYRVGKIILVGGSMGGASVLTFTALHPELVAGVCAQNPLANHVEYANFQDAIAASFGGDKKTAPKEYRKRSAEFHPEAFTMPLAVTTGGKDTSVPPQSVLRLVEAVKRKNPDVLLIHRENGGHATNYEDTAEALDFVIRRVLDHKD
jgi:pimeloyl-ACP methyl ester carboxylesterase